MVPERLTPENTTIILVDFAVGFANVLRSHDLAHHINNVAGLAATAVGFNSGLVVTNGPPSRPSGPLYPQLLEIIGVVPINWYGLAGEFHYNHANPTAATYQAIQPATSRPWPWARRPSSPGRLSARASKPGRPRARAPDAILGCGSGIGGPRVGRPGMGT